MTEHDNDDNDNNDSTLNKKLSKARHRIRELELEREDFMSAKLLQEVNE